uniref:Uncharacterized protein n=1 Tax=Octopus bimaculoides TaxID=37653 RepID=A0A0L8H3L2_OCTBM
MGVPEIKVCTYIQEMLLRREAAENQNQWVRGRCLYEYILKKFMVLVSVLLNSTMCKYFLLKLQVNNCLVSEFSGRQKSI